MSAEPLDDVGWTQLKNEIGVALEDGSGVVVAVAEAPADVDTTLTPPSVAYFPDVSDPLFAGKNLHDATQTNAGVNTHATGVSKIFFGSTISGTAASMASGITDITMFDANDWLARIGESSGGAAAPAPLTNNAGQTFDVQNHSYIASSSSATDILQRVDFVVNRDNSTIVVGVNNSSANTTPDLLAPGYNTISVGRSDGEHSRGSTTFYGSGRSKPEIVAPQGTTSSATPMVSSAAAVLRQAGAGTNATQNEAIKAILFAGATKDGLPGGWSRSPTSPLDSVYGVGQLNIRNSYYILKGGEQDAAGNVDPYGFDYETSIPQGTSISYDFNLPLGATEVSIALTWNILVADGQASDPTMFIPETTFHDLDLRLYDSSGGGTIVDSSISLVDNVEHIYLTNLVGGQYTLEVSRKPSSSTAVQDFAVAWRITAVPEPSSFACLLVVALLTYAKRTSQGKQAKQPVTA